MAVCKLGIKSETTFSKITLSKLQNNKWIPLFLFTKKGTYHLKKKKRLLGIPLHKELCNYVEKYLKSNKYQGI